MDEQLGAELSTNHRFLDEAGDTTFFGKKKVLKLGDEGVSNYFSIGMVKIKTGLNPIRDKIREIQQEIIQDKYYKDDWRVQSRIKKPTGFYLHATDDPESVRKQFFSYILNLDLSFEMVVARKIPNIYIMKHNSEEKEFYADVLSHLLKNKLKSDGKLILNISERGNSTKNSNLNAALDKATTRYKKNNGDASINKKVEFNVQSPTREPILCIADYLCWSVQRVFEKEDYRTYNYMKEKIKLVIDLYDDSKYEGNKNYYTIHNPLTNLKT